MAEPTDDQILQEQIGRLAELVSKLVEGGGNANISTIVHKTEGPTPWQAAALAVMFCTLFMLLLFAAWVIPMLHDLQAWRDIHQNHISVLESKQK